MDREHRAIDEQLAVIHHHRCVCDNDVGWLPVSSRVMRWGRNSPHTCEQRWLSRPTQPGPFLPWTDTTVVPRWHARSNDFERLVYRMGCKLNRTAGVELLTCGVDFRLVFNLAF